MSAQRESAILDGIAEHLRTNFSTMLATGTGLALIVVFVLRAVVPMSTLITWCAVVVVWNISRQFLFSRYLDRPESGISARKWLLIFSVTTTLSGLFWGIGGAVLFPLSSPPHQVFLAFILGGAIAGVVGNYSSHLPTFFAYAAVAMAPLITRFLLVGDEMSLVMGGTLGIYLVTVSVLVINVNRSIRRSIELTVDNRALVDDLMRSKERYDLSLRGANDGIWDWDISGNKIYASPRLREMFGQHVLKPDDGPRRFMDAVHPDDRTAYRDAVVAHLKGETPYLNHEFRLAGTEGDGTRWMMIRGLALRDETGRAYRMAGSITDISTLKRADWALRNANERLEQEVEARTQQLSQSQERLSSILSGARDGIALVDVDGSVLEINDAAARDFGHEREDMMGRNFFDFVGDGTDEPSVRERVALLSNGAPRTFLSQTGGRWHEISVQPIFGDDGKVRRCSVIARDITERRELEEHLAASQKIEALGQVAGGVAHEFNNLLQAVVGYLELIKTKTGDQKDLDNLASRALRIALGGQTLTQGLLSYVGKGRVRPQVIDTTRFVKEFSQTLPGSMGDRYRVVTAIDDDLWPLSIDTGQLQASLLNLVTNARDAMPTGGTLTIEVANSTVSDAFVSKRHERVAPGDYVRISVKDTGLGMSENVLEHMFDPFFTTKAPGEGTGLGLSMVFGFIRHQSGGFVDVQSTAGKGTTVSIYLPRSTQVEVQPNSGPPAPTATARDVLVVEDNPAVLDSTKSVLEMLGHRVVTSGDGDSALAVLGSNSRFDILITDIVMPGRTNGISLATHARRTHPEIKIILMTGYDEKEFASNRSLPADREILQKPFRPEDLRKAIDRLYALAT